MNKLNYILFAVVLMLFAFTANETRAQSKQQVRFAKGATSATFRGVLKGQPQRYADYIVRAAAGQTMEVKLIGETKAEFVIFKPKTLENLSLGDKEWSGELPESGDYTVRVILNRNFARRGVKTDYRVQISVQ
ncbi:MAG TPA: hypothetical protein VK308_10165 [Pyrinomonadaceae bacterium]|nr:hypothetical protein [Pyrinomonadaceae bacterium]